MPRGHGRAYKGPEFGQVLSGKRHSHTAPDAGLLAPGKSSSCPLECSRRVPEPVVSLCGCAIERDPRVFDPAGLDLCRHLVGNKCPVGAERGFYPHFPAAFCNLPDVGTDERFPTGEDDKRYAGCCHVIDERKCFKCRKFSLCRAVRGRAAVTVHAAQGCSGQ